MPNFIENVRVRLQKSIDTTPERVSIFFKTAIGDYAQHDQFMGVTVPMLRKIAKEFSSLSFDDLGLLISSFINEERLLALLILVNQYQTGDGACQQVICQFYLKNLKHVNNWNLVDSSAHHILGHYLWDKDRSTLNKLSKSDILWERRIAVVATWYFIRKGDLSTTFEISKLLLNDKHDLIHKAVGWMLREAGKKDEAKLMHFLSEYANQMPKIMLRYAMERLTPEQRALFKA